MSEKILVVGPAGGREHALLWSMQGDDRELFVTGGNAGTDVIAKSNDEQYARLNTRGGVKSLARWAVEQEIDFTVVGPDNALAAGVVDAFEGRGLHIFGPTQAAARLESSKAWAGKFKKKYDIPSPVDVSFADGRAAMAYAHNNDPENYVVKEDGLAFGKGVEPDPAKAREKVRDIVRKGKAVVFQERLEGPELSIFAVCDGENSVLLPTFRDYKRVYDGDKGPNTGGMGAYGPVPGYGQEYLEQIRKSVITPTLQGMQSEKSPFKGVMYVGLMLTKDGPKVIEYNVRFGDPEFQAMALLLDEDLLELTQKAAGGELTDRHAKIKSGAALTIALTAKGYPSQTYKTGEVIDGLYRLPDNVVAFHGGIKNGGLGRLVTNGGRVVHLATRAENIDQAREQLYGTDEVAGVIGEHAVNFAGMHYRTDIAQDAA